MPSLSQSFGKGWLVSLTVNGFPATAVRESLTTEECSGSLTIGVFTGGGEPGCCQYVCPSMMSSFASAESMG